MKEGVESSRGFLSWECPVCPQKAALAQLPELAPAQPELGLAGDQPPVLGPAQPAPEVLPAPAHSHHGEVLRAPQAGLDLVSWGQGDQDGAHMLQLVLCPQPGPALGCGGGKAKPRAVCSGKCEPSGIILASRGAPGIICHCGGCRCLRGVKSAAAT